MEAVLCPSLFHNQIVTAISSNPHLSSQDLQVQAEDGHVRLDGKVNSFFQKQMAQELVRRIDGVELVENHLQVNWR